MDASLLFSMLQAFIYMDTGMDADVEHIQMDAQPNSSLSTIINLAPRTSKQIASCHLLNVEEWLQQNSTLQIIK